MIFVAVVIFVCIVMEYGNYTENGKFTGEVIYDRITSISSSSGMLCFAYICGAVSIIIQASILYGIIRLFI